MPAEDKKGNTVLLFSAQRLRSPPFTKEASAIVEYAKLGNTDIEVSKLCVGCMSFGKAGTLHDWTVDETGTEKIVKHA